MQDVRISLACIGFLPESIITEMVNHAVKSRTAWLHATLFLLNAINLSYYELPSGRIFFAYYGMSCTTVSGGVSSRWGSLKIRFRYFMIDA